MTATAPASSGGARFDHPRLGGLWLVPAGLALVVFACWIAAATSGRVLLQFVGDEAARVLRSFEYTRPADLIGFVSDGRSWLTIHPPGDIALKAIVNQAFQLFVDTPDGFVRIHKTLSVLFVGGGLALIATGLATRVSRVAAATFVALTLSSTAIVYAAHHALGEAPALFLVGWSVFLAIGDAWRNNTRTVVAALPLAMACLIRPEASLVFAALAVLPILRGQWRRGALFAAVAVGPAVSLTIITELLTDSATYASVRPFSSQTILSVFTDERLANLLWGLGIAPWLGLVSVVVLFGAGLVLRRWAPTRLVSVALAASWICCCVMWVGLISRGVIPQQERVFVFPALSGALAVAMLAHAVITPRPDGGERHAARLVALLAAFVLAWQGLGGLPDRYEAWSHRVPVQVIEVNDYLRTHWSRDGHVLLDWMWWWEWPAGVYATRPGMVGQVCNYGIACGDSVLEGPPTELTLGLVPAEVERLDKSWRFMAGTAPDSIVIMTEDFYRQWREASSSNPEVLSSFVRPLLRQNGECYRTHPRLPPAEYCPTLRNDRYIVLERQ